MSGYTLMSPLENVRVYTYFTIRKCQGIHLCHHQKMLGYTLENEKVTVHNRSIGIKGRK
jgi:hypothetical protein